MNVQHGPTAVSENRERHSSARVPGRWLAIARAVWIVLALLLLANFIASIPATYGQLRTLCTNSTFGHCNIWQPTPANMQALYHLGLSLDTYAVYTLTIDVLASLVFLAVGALIFWRKSDEWMGLFVSLVLVIFGSFGIAGSLAGTFITAQTPGVVKLLYLLFLLQWPALGALLLTFPTGRFVPRWSWVVVLLWLLQDWFFTIGNIVNWPLVLIAADFLLVLGSTAGIQVYRYLRVYNHVQRQQTKWLVYALSVYVVIVVLFLVIGGLVPAFSQPDSPYRLARATMNTLFFILIPLSIGLAILRYRLWDIDLIIHRTLVYGSLTALLALVYFGLVIGLQALVRLFTGQVSQSPVVIVASTLAIAALFHPLRKRIQTIIDRRFYRRKYDAAKTVAAFSATLRQEVDLEQLREQLLAVVQETMQPSHVSLWLRPPEHDGTQRATWRANPPGDANPAPTPKQ
jgi:hypothetical protein